MKCVGVAAIIAAATIGDGIFALPFVFAAAGWAVGLFYLVTFAILVGIAHVIYLKTLEKRGEKERLLELARIYFGPVGFWTAFIAIVLGLLFALVACLLLGARFIGLVLPSLAGAPTLFIFWALISLPILLSDRRVAVLEFLGIACTTAIIIFIFTNAWPNASFARIPAVDVSNIFLPFGAILLSLAGWTGVEPAYELRKTFGDRGDQAIDRGGQVGDPGGQGQGRRRGIWKAVISGTLFAAFLYVLFVAGILGSATQIASDTISGLADWPLWKRELVALFGLVAVGTVCLPISRELKNAFEKDLRWPRASSRALIVFAPIALVLAGFKNFLFVVGFTGGVFISIQYLLIVMIGGRALAPRGAKRLLFNLMAAVFALAAVYEVAIFVVH